jgi:hypothetical protein
MMRRLYRPITVMIRPTARIVLLSMCDLDRMGQRTGSYPPGWKGWHFASRRRERYPPRTTPYFSIDSIA